MQNKILNKANVFPRVARYLPNFDRQALFNAPHGALGGRAIYPEILCSEFISHPEAVTPPPCYLMKEWQTTRIFRMQVLRDHPLYLCHFYKEKSTLSLCLEHAPPVFAEGKLQKDEKGNMTADLIVSVPFSLFSAVCLLFYPALGQNDKERNSCFWLAVMHSLPPKLDQAAAAIPTPSQAIQDVIQTVAHAQCHPHHIDAQYSIDKGVCIQVVGTMILQV